jgi:hypothetical protein
MIRQRESSSSSSRAGIPGIDLGAVTFKAPGAPSDAADSVPVRSPWSIDSAW